MMRIAKEHAVQGVVANAVAQGHIALAVDGGGDKEAAVMKLMSVDVQCHRKYLRFGKAVACLAMLLDTHHVRYVIFKGVALAHLYPVPQTRAMGDVDFYVPAPDFDKAVEVIERELKVKIEKEEIDKHYSFDWQEVRFEMHYQIETFGNACHQRYFNRMIDACIARGADRFSIADEENAGEKTEVAVLPPEENLIVVFKHWFNHLLVEGVGLRQTTDLAVLLNVYQDRVDVGQLTDALDGIGYMNAFRAMLAMMKKYYALSCVGKYSLLNGCDERYADKLMGAVMESGNFGRKAYRNQSVGRKKSIETATRALRHCVRFFWLAPLDICCLVPKRIGITLKQKL